MTRKEGIELLEKYLRRENSFEELLVLRRWMNESDHVEAISGWMDKNWADSSREVDCVFDAEVMLRNIKEQLEQEEEIPRGMRKKKLLKESNKPLHRWLQVVAAVLLPLFFFGLGHYWNNFMESPEQLAYLQTIVPKGQKAQVVLADGTEVWLNSETEISYPSKFEADKREVELKGEAFFKVTKNSKCPFVVNMSDMKIKVLGTEFNVCNYEAEEMVETTLVNGSVQLQVLANGPYHGKVITLEPNQKVSYNRRDSKIKLQVVNPESYTSWKEGKLIFRSVDFETLARKLERWYDVKIYFEDEELKDYRYTGTFDRETVEQAVEALRLTSPFNYKMDKRNIYISKL